MTAPLNHVRGIPVAAFGADDETPVAPRPATTAHSYRAIIGEPESSDRGMIAIGMMFCGLSGAVTGILGTLLVQWWLG